VLVVQELGGNTGVAFTLPLVLFLFVVALGTDYNILMTARLREEMLAGKPVREPWPTPSATAPAVGAAGLVLASSFGTLMLEANQQSKQMGFAMAFGILLASLIVSSVLVPAVTALAGRRAWWPADGPSASRSERRHNRRSRKTTARSSSPHSEQLRHAVTTAPSIGARKSTCKRGVHGVQHPLLFVLRCVVH
jgi:putative drug exporter of the RND superfamily